MRNSANLILILCGFTLVSGARADKLPSVRELIFKGIENRSPLGRYRAKDYSPGAKDLRTDPRCVVADLQEFFKLQIPPASFRSLLLTESFRDSKPNERTRDLHIDVKDFEEQLLLEIKKFFKFFPSERDPVVKNRELCVGSGLFAAPNAVSLGLGFLVFDPRLFFQLIRSENSNSWSMSAVIAHEFAHQLQYWHLDPYVFREKNGKKHVRELELQADCIAAALLTRLSTSELREKDLPFATSLYNAFISMGDFELFSSEHHHGTSWERSVMVDAGMRVAGDLRKTQLDEISGEILKACRLHIDNMNRKHGDVIWPFGQKLPL